MFNIIFILCNIITWINSIDTGRYLQNVDRYPKSNKLILFSIIVNSVYSPRHENCFLAIANLAAVSSQWFAM